MGALQAGDKDGYVRSDLVSEHHAASAVAPTAPASGQSASTLTHFDSMQCFHLNNDGKSDVAQALLDDNQYSCTQKTFSGEHTGCVIPDISAFSLTLPGVVAAIGLYETHAVARLPHIPLSKAFLSK